MCKPLGSAECRNWRWTALAAAGIIIVVIVALAIWNFYLRGPYIEPASIEPERGTIAPDQKEAPKTIAVLPFDDISPDKDQGYFVDGLSEEISTSLEQIPKLTVIARTSSFSFKESNKTNQEIAAELGVDHILRGSIRKAGDALRITVRLIKAVDNSSLWSETYDRELKDIFKTQEDIAKSVADKLKLTLEAFQLLGGTENIQAYELYLRARGQFGTGVEEGIREIMKLLDNAISLDPDFALAWSLKARNHILLHVYLPAFMSIEQENAGIKAVQKAIELEPNLTNPYVELGSIKMLQGEWIEAELNFSKSIELTQDSISGDHILIIPFYLSVGKLKKARELAEEMMKNDPINRAIGAWYCLTWGLLDDRQRAEDEYFHRNKMDGFTDFYNRLITAVRLGSRDILSKNDILSVDQISTKLKEYINSPREGLIELHRIYTDDKNLSTAELGAIAIWAAYFGDTQLAMSSIEKGARISGDVMNCWLPVMREVRQIPRFKEFVREIGLVDYWKEYGWPDLCRPVGYDDFVCD